MNKKLFIFIFSVILALSNGVCFAQVSSKGIMSANPLEVVKNPNSYLNKAIKMNVVFDKFTTLGLDYDKTKHSGEDYIGFLIQRSDVIDHNVPLSEMKLFLKRSYAEKFAELETGDKLEISGIVFSNALGDPWVDINSIVIKEKVKK